MIRMLVLIACLVLPGAAAAAPAKDAFDFAFTSIEGTALPLERFRGRPLMVVNTASFCGFTHQYEGLQALWSRYRERGLTVLGVPSNDFGGQEPGSNAAIKAFCEATFAVDFPLTEKVAVTGDESHPLFDHIRGVLGERAGPRWNFSKYLIAPDGAVIASWPSSVAPEDPAIIEAIEALLPEVAS